MELLLQRISSLPFELSSRNMNSRTLVVLDEYTFGAHYPALVPQILAQTVMTKHRSYSSAYILSTGYGIWSEATAKSSLRDALWQDGIYGLGRYVAAYQQSCWDWSVERVGRAM